MPYKLKSVGKGKYKVCKKKGSKCFSKKGLSKKTAQQQMKAIYRSENMKKESFDQLVNGYLSKFIFEDAPPTLNKPANPTAIGTQTYKKAQQNKVEEDRKKATAIPTEKDVETFMNGVKAGQSGKIPKQ